MDRFVTRISLPKNGSDVKDFAGTSKGKMPVKGGIAKGKKRIFELDEVDGLGQDCNNNISRQDDATTSSVSDPKKPKKTHRKGMNIEKYLNDFSWLKIDVETKLSYCTLCTDSGAKSLKHSAFVVGSPNLQRSAFVRHEQCSDHLMATRIAKQRQHHTAAVRIVKEKMQPQLLAQLRTCTFMAKQNISDRLYPQLIDLQVLNIDFYYFPLNIVIFSLIFKNVK